MLLTSGKVYWDLVAKRAKEGREDTAIVRLEQLYPLAHAEMASELAKYPNAEIVWVQDEPRNQGAWSFLALGMPEALAPHGETRPWRCVSRPASAAPSTGSTKVHQIEQEKLMDEAFAR